MPILNFDEPSRSSRKGVTPITVNKPLKLILGIGALAGVIALGSTLAANIGINTGAPIEFGQGVAQTTSCDSQVILTPNSTFVNADGGGEFKFTGVALSGLDTTDQSGPSQGCAGKSFTIKVYNKLGVENATSYSINVGTGEFTSPDGVISGDSFGEEGAATLSFGSTLIAATDVYRITIESATGSSIWDGITWTESTEAGPLRYADSLTGDQPVWLRDTTVSLTAGSAFEYGSSSKGLHIIGDANIYGYPYITDFTIPEAQKVTVQFTFYHNSQCSDQGVILFSDGTLPAWVWGSNSSGFAAQFDCEYPELNTMDSSASGSNILTIGQAYIGILTYDPSLVSVANLTFVTKTLTGVTLDTRRLWGTLPAGSDYRVGISADSDIGNKGLPAYFKNLIITIG